MLKPLGSRVIIKVEKEKEKTIGGIVLASTAKEKSQTGEIISIGNNVYIEDNCKIKLDVKVGDIVMFEKYAGTDIEYNNKKYLIVNLKDIIAIVN